MLEALWYTTATRLRQSAGMVRYLPANPLMSRVATMSTAQRQTFGVVLKRHRRAAQLTQEALAGKAGYSPGYISMLERSERPPTPAAATMFADAVGLAPEERTLLIALATPGVSGAKPATTASRVSRPRGPQLPLVGRSRELWLLDEQLTHADTLPVPLLPAGEPGIGKTRMLLEPADRAHAAGWDILW